MPETAALDIVFHQRVHDGIAVFNEALIGFRIDAQRAQRGEHLRNGFAGGHNVAVAVESTKAAVVKLHFGKACERRVHRRIHIHGEELCLPLVHIVARERLQRHAGHI